jgi:hypothetical protein
MEINFPLQHITVKRRQRLLSLSLSAMAQRSSSFFSQSAC